MLDIGGGELLLIGIVALIVVGPKDLPGMFHTLGRFIAKARSMGREFQRAMDEAARESGVKDVADDLKTMTSKKSLGLDALEKAASKFEKWDPKKHPAARGPATQALAEKRAAETAERMATLGAKPKSEAGTAATAPSEPPAATPAPKKAPGRVRSSRIDAGAAPAASAKTPATKGAKDQPKRAAAALTKVAKPAKTEGTAKAAKPRATKGEA